MIVDDTLSLIGSINLEPLSFNKLDEGAVVIEDAAFAAEMAKQFAEDLSRSKLEAGKPL